MRNAFTKATPLRTQFVDAADQDEAFLKLHGFVVVDDKDAPQRFSVWSDNRTDVDIIGAGDTRSEAIEDARKTVRGWESSR
jgi:hypothetical protein